VKNRRPISNLPFISKLIEKVVVAMRIEECDDLNDSYRFAYRRGHSTEAALLLVRRDIAQAPDEGPTTVLYLYDTIEAF